MPKPDYQSILHRLRITLSEDDKATLRRLLKLNADATNKYGEFPSALKRTKKAKTEKREAG